MSVFTATLSSPEAVPETNSFWILKENIELDTWSPLFDKDGIQVGTCSLAKTQIGPAGVLTNIAVVRGSSVFVGCWAPGPDQVKVKPTYATGWEELFDPSNVVLSFIETDPTDSTKSKITLE
jgi:hypothetical protein